MINVRHALFETNSSSVHSLVLKKHKYDTSKKTVSVRPISTFEQSSFDTIEDKLSYLVSYILYNRCVLNCDDLDDALDSHQFKAFAKTVKELTGIKLIVPEDFDVDEIEFNHQLIEDRYYDVDDFISSICGTYGTLGLEQILDDTTRIYIYMG